MDCVAIAGPATSPDHQLAAGLSVKREAQICGAPSVSHGRWSPLRTELATRFIRRATVLPMTRVSDVTFVTIWALSRMLKCETVGSHLQPIQRRCWSHSNLRAA